MEHFLRDLQFRCNICFCQTNQRHNQAHFTYGDTSPEIKDTLFGKERRNKQSLEKGSEPWLYPGHRKRAQENDAWKSDFVKLWTPPTMASVSNTLA